MRARSRVGCSFRYCHATSTSPSSSSSFCRRHFVSTSADSRDAQKPWCGDIGIRIHSRGLATESLGWGESAAASGVVGRWDEDKLHTAAQVLANPQAQSGDRPDFELAVAQSGVEGAGLGVFVQHGDDRSKSAITEGTVVALYPGVFIPLVPLRARAFAKGEAVTDVLHLSRLWGYGAVEDELRDVSFDEASSYWLILEKYSGVMDGFCPQDRSIASSGLSTYSVGNLINHPPKGVRPNVTWQEFCWKETDVNVSNRLHTGLWYMDPLSGEPVNMPRKGSEVRIPLPGIAIVAVRSIEVGEELFMNYKLSKPHPPWYTPVDD